MLKKNSPWIKLYGGFISGPDGDWYNLNMIKRFYIEEHGIFSFIWLEIGDESFKLISEQRPKCEMQEKLDGLFKLMDYERGNS